MAHWWLTVRYPTSRPDGYYWGSLDAAIVAAVGRLDERRDTNLHAAERSLSFGFSNEGAARNARRRVLALHKRGIRTTVAKGGS